VEKLPVSKTPIRHLVVIFGDQLDHDALIFDDFDKDRDMIWMAEVLEESQVVPSHKVRTAMFLSAMRHFHVELIQRNLPVEYTKLDDPDNEQTFAKELARTIRRLQPEEIRVTQPGEFRVLEALKQVAKGENLPLNVLADPHFFSQPEEFAKHAEGRKEVRLEYFYRELRKKHNILMANGKPVGGSWNYDKENRGTFSKKGPVDLKVTRKFTPNKITKQVFEIVNMLLPENPGNLQNFDWPVCRNDALLALSDFIEHRLADFGKFQDAMWQGEPFLYHSRLSAALNLKLLNPREVVAAAVTAYQEGNVPLNATEGFIRQILGWREYVRGVYWWLMPDYVQRNAMNATQDLPEFYWTAETDMNCMSSTIKQTLDYGYAHHIQRLMVTGLFALLLGVDPKQIHSWYLAVYLDAVEWVELPNTLGMSQFADGGVMASKPYIATGKYIDRMSNYCKGCRFDPNQKTGEDACPFTTLYWDYLSRHQEALSKNQRISLQLRNLERLEGEEIQAIKKQAATLRKQIANKPPADKTGR